MTIRPVAAAALLLCAGLVSPHVPADGPGGYGARSKEAETEYERTARDAYATGYALIESASRLDRDAAAASDERAHRMVMARAVGKYEAALRAFDDATRLEPGMYEAHTYIGYANRKLGRYDRALAAYETALRLKPDYARAIEYQGEAYLGLDRFEQAKFNYLRLYALDTLQAQKLFDAMQNWVNERTQGSRLPGEALSAASQWISARRGMGNSEGAKDYDW